ncbi:hypothetical protein M885DRAFT_499760 [Pelagophyceae sp. CCMP2097]|nr:hypothetical protein M885DRAFT_499760 [Pelagophyceae sp. CCMP2097]
MDPARASSSSHAAERRQRLEHELSLLQADVATLCTKLTKSPFEDDDEGPAPAAAARKTPGLDGGEDRVMKVSARARQKRDDDDDANGADSVDGAPATAGKAPKGTEARLRRSLEAMTRRRDAADCDVKRLKLEADKLRARADKYAELQRAHAGLQLDYAALRASLEASERIRMKQKELLQLVERNNGEERWTTALGARRGAQLADGLRDGDAIDDVLRDGYDDFDDAGDDLRQPPHADDGVGTPDLVSTASSLVSHATSFLLESLAWSNLAHARRAPDARSA